MTHTPSQYEREIMRRIAAKRLQTVLGGLRAKGKTKIAIKSPDPGTRRVIRYGNGLCWLKD